MHGFLVTVDDIAREGVSRRTIFRHFPTRDDLLAVALTQQSDTFRSTLPQIGNKCWPVWLAELCQAVHQANGTLQRTLHELITRHDLSPRLLTFADDVDAYRRGRNRDVADTLWQAIGKGGGAPAELGAVVASHLSPHFTTAVSQDAQGDHDGRVPGTRSHPRRAGSLLCQPQRWLVLGGGGGADPRINGRWDGSSRAPQGE
jgi:AcrR family transcriptional regulator